MGRITVELVDSSEDKNDRQSTTSGRTLTPNSKLSLILLLCVLENYGKHSLYNIFRGPPRPQKHVKVHYLCPSVFLYVSYFMSPLLIFLPLSGGAINFKYNNYDPTTCLSVSLTSSGQSHSVGLIIAIQPYFKWRQKHVFDQ